jgi:hypothetical protein
MIAHVPKNWTLVLGAKLNLKFIWDRYSIGPRAEDNKIKN